MGATEVVSKHAKCPKTLPKWILPELFGWWPRPEGPSRQTGRVWAEVCKNRGRDARTKNQTPQGLRLVKNEIRGDTARLPHELCAAAAGCVRWPRPRAMSPRCVSPHPRVSASTVRVTVLAIRSAAAQTFPAIPANTRHARKQPALHEAQCHGLKICAFCRLTCHHSAREGRVRRGIRADFGPKRA